MRIAGLLCGLGLLLAAAPSHAHTRSLSYSNWTVDDRVVDVRVRIPRLELTRLGAIGYEPPESPLIGDYLATRLLLSRGGTLCPVTRAPTARAAPEGWAIHQWQLTCPASHPGAEEVITTSIMLEAAPSHLHFARVERGERRVVERVLSSAEPQWVWNESHAASGLEGTSVARYVAIGVEHILTGWDHLAFVVALLLLAANLGEVARLVTGFTVAHSVTLALAVLGWVHPKPTAVEAVIGFSVFLIAAENAWQMGGKNPWVPRAVVTLLVGMGGVAVFTGGLPALAILGLATFSACHFGILGRVERPARWRGALAFAFGLVHGFGFAGVLAEIQLPTERLAPALFGFNVGVELGQLGVVALAWPLLRGLARLRPGGRPLPIAELVSAGVAGLGLYWFVVRTFG